MGWNEDECGEEVVYASNETEAEVRYANGDLDIVELMTRTLRDNTTSNSQAKSLRVL